MALSVFATKVGMTQIFTEEGVVVPVTVLQTHPNVVLQKKTVENDGYTALQVGYKDKPAKRTNKPDAGHFKKADTAAKRYVREMRVDADTVSKYEVGASIPLFDVLNEVTSVDVTGTSKGKGFAGVMKRHNFSGFRATHGTHEYFRHGGSIGCRSKPGKVHKGKRMPGQMGNVQVTTINVAVEEVRPDEGLIFLRGAVPGTKGGIVELRASARTAKRGRTLAGAVEIKSKNPMKASKAAGGRR